MATKLSNEGAHTTHKGPTSLSPATLGTFLFCDSVSTWRNAINLDLSKGLIIDISMATNDFKSALVANRIAWTDNCQQSLPP